MGGLKGMLLLLLALLGGDCSGGDGRVGRLLLRLRRLPGPGAVFVIRMLHLVQALESLRLHVEDLLVLIRQSLPLVGEHLGDGGAVVAAGDELLAVVLGPQHERVHRPQHLWKCSNKQLEES